MKILIVGTGYVGLVSAAGLAELGHQVIAVDINQQKINKLRKGILPFYEPDLKKIVLKNLKNKRLNFINSINSSFDNCQCAFICVGTPPKKDGSADLKYIKSAALELGKKLNNYKIIINKSTVPVGTCKLIKRIIKRNYSGNFSIISCPEFLREGKAINDFFHPDRIIVGGDDNRAINTVIDLFKTVKTNKIKTTLETAELIKYASNAFLATKISFINEIANVCEKVGADVEEVALGMGLDKRIGQNFLRAGIGYGGSCFPKDVRALQQLAGGHGYKFKLLKSVIEVNRNQKLILTKKIKEFFTNIKNKKIAILGLAFKDNTDDVRESAAIDIIKNLKRRGALIQTYDPKAMKNAKKIFDSEIIYCPDPYKAVKGAQLLIIATEWPQFKKLDWRKIKKLMKNNIVLDGKNLLDKEKMIKLGFRYYAIGRS